MKLELPGQLRGPECNAVMAVAVALRRELEPIVGAITGNGIKRVCLVLRVAGSLGDFGAAGIGSPTIDGDTVESDVVFADEDWANQSPQEIREILAPVVVQALHECLEFVGIEAAPIDLSPGR